MVGVSGFSTAPFKPEDCGSWGVVGADGGKLWISLQDDEGACVPFILARIPINPMNGRLWHRCNKNTRDSAFYTHKGKTIRYDMI